MTKREASSSIYSFLSANVPSEGLTVRPTEVETPEGPVVHAINSRAETMLLIPVNTVGPASATWENDSISFVYQSLGANSEKRPYLVLSCLAPRLVREFSLMTDDVLDSIDTSPRDAERLARQVVHRWREMLREQRRPLMSDEKIVGLLAELLFLEELAHSHGPQVLQGWLGPAGGRHDFVFANADVEIKGSTGRETFDITIHGRQQLQSAPGVDLFVRGYLFETHPSGDSVPMVLQRLREVGLDRFELLKRVVTLGYSEADTEYYSGRQLVLLSTRTCRVHGAFPRLNEETVDRTIFAKLRNVSYTIDLGTEPEAALDLMTLRLGA